MAPVRSLLTCLFAGLAIASPAPAQKRDLITAELIISNVNGIQQGVQDLRRDVAAYNGTLLSEAPLLGDFLEITIANRAGYTVRVAWTIQLVHGMLTFFQNANLKTGVFDSADSASIVTDVIDTVGISIPAAVNETVAKKALFEQGGSGGLIEGTLEVLLYEHESFSTALQAKISEDQQARAQAVVDKIIDAIQYGIDQFATS